MNTKSRLRDADVISGAILAALGTYILAQARGWVYYGPDGPGPGFFPTWYGLAMVALSALLIANRIMRDRADEEGAIKWGGAGRALGTWAAFAGCALLLKPLGFALSFAALTFFVVKIIFGRPMLTAAVTAIGASAVFQLVFPLTLGVPLPVGMLGF